MTVPVVGNFGRALYEAVGPLAYADADNGYGLLALAGALSTPFETIYDWALDDDEERPGWSVLVDLDRIPSAALGWSGQLVGVRLLPGTTDEEKRTRIANTDGMKRGSTGAIIAAAQLHLIGDKKVILRERYDPDFPSDDKAYHLTVYTFEDETPDEAQVLAAIQLQKPGGIILHYETRPGQDWQTLYDEPVTWADVLGTYDNWADVSGTY